MEIQGFKSFAEKTEIVFEAGTTAIVGPNGSGKSNISDAVRWVLGEQSAKQLRGAKMEDVIFGGTEKRKALTWCEVSLLFDNEDRALSMDCAEVLVTRRVWRSGDSEYYLNKAACRLKDITELFRDTGIGKEGYSLIGQGRIDAILASKSEDRREVFEEAAGIVTYRARKDEAERRMDNTRQNLSRVEDILSELEMQLGPLEKQSDDAKRYLAVRDALRACEMNTFIRQHDRLKDAQDKQEQLLQELTDEIDTITPDIEALAETREQLAIDQDAAETADQEAQQQVLSAARALEAREGANNVLRERVAHQEKDAGREAALQQEESGRQTALSALLDESRQEIETREKRLEEAAKILADLQREAETAAETADQREEKLEAHKAAIMRQMNRMADVKTQQARLSALKQSLSGRLEEAERAALSLGSAREDLGFAVMIAEEELATAKGALASLDAEARRLDEAVQAAGQDSEGLLSSIRQKTGERHEATSRLKVLREMERDYEGYQHAVRQALLYARGDQSVHGVVAENIRTPKQYETALEMVLGQALQQIITEDEYTAKRLIEYLAKNRYGRATFLPMTTVRGRTLSNDEREALKLPGCLGVASELVSFDPKYRGVVESLLGRTVIARTLDEGIQIMRRGRQAFRLVTLDGNVMHSGGSMTGGSVQSRMTSLLSREREIEEHTKLVEKLSQEIEEAQTRLDVLDQERQTAKHQRNQLFDQAHQAEIGVARETEHLENARATLAAHDARQEEAELLADQIRTNLQDIDEQLTRATADHDDTEMDQQDMQQETQRLSEALQTARREVERLRGAVTDASVTSAQQERELSAAKREGERLLSEAAQLIRQQEKRGETLQDQQEALALDIERLSQGEADLILCREALEARRAEQTESARIRQQLQHQARETAEKLETLRERLSADTDRRHKAELALVKAQNDLKNLQERIWSEYELTYAGAMEYFDADFDLREGEKKVAQMRQEIRQMGPVNVNAVEEYRLTKERFDMLDAQRSDLTKAIADLEEIIRELLVKMERRFRKQFMQLNEYFGKAFRMLFGGGQAELRFTDESDILNCGIDVIAQPPGKKLQLLTLLSGGERALTAIAILFAMLQLKPTPFCILDEIEAALDEANVANFADYLNKFSEKTQFVVVTHRRGTMERCQALYGVAMEERGVSRMVSVKLAGEGA